MPAFWHEMSQRSKPPINEQGKLHEAGHSVELWLAEATFYQRADEPRHVLQRSLTTVQPISCLILLQIKNSATAVYFKLTVMP